METLIAEATVAKTASPSTQLSFTRSQRLRPITRIQRLRLPRFEDMAPCPQPSTAGVITQEFLDYRKASMAYDKMDDTRFLYDELRDAWTKVVNKWTNLAVSVFTVERPRKNLPQVIPVYAIAPAGIMDQYRIAIAQMASGDLETSPSHGMSRIFFDRYDTTSVCGWFDLDNQALWFTSSKLFRTSALLLNVVERCPKATWDSLPET